MLEKKDELTLTSHGYIEYVSMGTGAEEGAIKICTRIFITRIIKAFIVI